MRRFAALLVPFAVYLVCLALLGDWAVDESRHFVRCTGRLLRIAPK